MVDTRVALKKLEKLVIILVFLSLLCDYLLTTMIIPIIREILPGETSEVLLG